MAMKMTRRDFINGTAQAGWAALAGAPLLSAAGKRIGPTPLLGAAPDLVSVRSADASKAAAKAVELLGGMSKFVPKGSRVALLPNSQSAHPGTFTKPGILRAVIRMCREAGAAQVDVLSWLKAKNWEATGLAEVIRSEGASLVLVENVESQFKPVPLAKGKDLTEARIMRAVFEHDVLIDMPIVKDHAGNRFTGTMKNLMGINYSQVNLTFHSGRFKDPDDIGHLDQCIADLNLAVRPALCVVDLTEMISTNGPFGPGKLIQPGRVAAGVDRVALDAYGASQLGIEAKDILMIRRAYDHGLGEIDLGRVKLAEVEA
jgi:uncharacterized protein (DUF362 family)